MTENVVTEEEAEGGFPIYKFLIQIFQTTLNGVAVIFRHLHAVTVTASLFKVECNI